MVGGTLEKREVSGRKRGGNASKLQNKSDIQYTGKIMEPHGRI